MQTRQQEVSQQTRTFNLHKVVLPTYELQFGEDSAQMN